MNFMKNYKGVCVVLCVRKLTIETEVALLTSTPANILFNIKHFLVEKNKKFIEKKEANGEINEYRPGCNNLAEDSQAAQSRRNRTKAPVFISTSVFLSEN